MSYFIKFDMVNKTKAKRLFNEGKDVWILPSNMRIDNIWIQPALLNKKNGVDFDTLVNGYMYYNCNNETGKNVHYFVESQK